MGVYICIYIWYIYQEIKAETLNYLIILILNPMWSVHSKKGKIGLAVSVVAEGTADISRRLQCAVCISLKVLKNLLKNGCLRMDGKICCLHHSLQNENLPATFFLAVLTAVI